MKNILLIFAALGLFLVGPTAAMAETASDMESSYNLLEDLQNQAEATKSCHEKWHDAKEKCDDKFDKKTHKWKKCYKKAKRKFHRCKKTCKHHYKKKKKHCKKIRDKSDRKDCLDKAKKKYHDCKGSRHLVPSEI